MKKKTSQMPERSSYVLRSWSKTILIGLAIGLTLTACKKENSTVTSVAPAKHAIVGEITGNDANILIGEINNFLLYAQEAHANPGVPVPPSVPLELDDADVVRYLENTFNFVYIQQEDNLVNTYADDFTIVIPKNANNKTTALEVANAFATAYTHTITAYNALNCPDDEKILRVTDVEISSNTSNSLTLSFSNVFKWKYDPSSPSPSTAAITFASSDWASYDDWGGSSLDPSVGAFGAPTLLNQRLNANWGGYLRMGGAPPKAKFSRYIVSGIKSADYGTFGPAHPHTAVAMSSNVTASNPWFLSTFGYAGGSYKIMADPLYGYLANGYVYDNRICMFEGMDAKAFAPPSPIASYHLPSSLLNYILDNCPILLHEGELAFNSSLWVLWYRHEGYSDSYFGSRSAHVMQNKFAKVIDLLTGLSPVTRPGPTATFGTF